MKASRYSGGAYFDEGMDLSSSQDGPAAAGAEVAAPAVEGAGDGAAARSGKHSRKRARRSAGAKSAEGMLESDSQLGMFAAAGAAGGGA